MANDVKLDVIKRKLFEAETEINNKHLVENILEYSLFSIHINLFQTELFQVHLRKKILVVDIVLTEHFEGLLKGTKKETNKQVKDKERSMKMCTVQ